MNILNFFKKLGFGNKDLIPWGSIFKNAADQNTRSLGSLLEEVYLYDKPKQTGAVFYLLHGQRELNSEEIRTIHKRIWNESKADLFIVIQNQLLVIYYAKTDPYYEPIKITEIPADEKDKELLQKISKAHFDSGAFWLVYQEALKNIEKKKRTVDAKLIDSLDALRGKLEKEYKNIINDTDEKKEIIQAIIDRTLFIKFLEDKKIINSYFYGYYFKDPQLSYKDLLYKKDAQNINKLFKCINSICNNFLFDEPIGNHYLTDQVLNLLYHTISQTDLKSKQKQMSLFDFQFDVIPVEFISRIYEAFLEDKQKKDAAYYTPEGLAELILDSLIKGTDCGSILDPSCGSGVFLVLAFRKMLKSANIKSSDTKEIIKKRNEFLKSNIFGIEKEPIARRITIFSLYLEMLNDIEPEKIKKVIKENITDADFKLFPEQFDKNILCADALETDEDKEPFKDKEFDFIAGNPPWKKVTEQDKEDNYWKKYQNNFTSEKQLSQFFLHKVKQWSKKTTRFGFVVNSSNFQNETKKFQNFFYNTYDIEKIYELTDIKKILFKSAKEPAVTVIFTNKKNQNNTIEYLAPDLTEFAKKFGIILLKQKDIISINQNDLIAGKVSIRDFLYGNQEDIELCEKILKSDKNQKLKGLLLKDENYNSIRGKQLAGEKVTPKEFEIENWNELSRKKKQEYHELYVKKYSQAEPIEDFNIPFITPEHFENFKINYKKVFYLSEKDNSKWERPRNEKIFEEEKILYPRVSNKAKAVFIDKKVYFSSGIFVIKLQDKYYYPLINAILNSTLINYLIYIKYRKRAGVSYPKINTNDLLNLPIPQKIPSDIYRKIKELNEIITSGKSSYQEKKEELDNLIFKLYGLDILERSRIIDFFKKGDVKEKDIVKYCETFNIVFRSYLEKGSFLTFEYENKKSLPIDFAGVKISFVKAENSNKITSAPPISKTVNFLNTEMLRSIGTNNVLTLKDKIYGNNCIYIIKDKNKKSWTTTKAVEDARVEIKRICG